MAPRWVLGGLGGKEGLEVSYFLSTAGEGFWKSMKKVREALPIAVQKQFSPNPNGR
jgi:hypothetical protein